MILRDGTETSDPRSLSFGVTEAILESPLKWDGLEPISKVRIKAKGNHLDQGREGACFPAGTFVRMADGSQKKIETVSVLDRVVTAEGNVGTVMQTMVRRSLEMVEVKLRGHLKVKCTPEHPFLTKSGYVQAKDLTPQHRVVSPAYQATTEDYFLCPDFSSDLRVCADRDVSPGSVRYKVKSLPDRFVYSKELGRLIGLYVAEGNVTPNKVVFNYGGGELETLAKETKDLILSCFGAEARIQIRPNGAVNVILYGKHWMRLFSYLVPGTSKHGDKRLSSVITIGPKDFLREVLYGWLAGDGHRKKGADFIGGITVSRNLALDMHSIAVGCGIFSGTNGSEPSVNRHAKTRQHRYEVNVYDGECKSSFSDTDEKGVWRMVTGVERCDPEGSVWVFNLHVEGDNSYVADGLGVHNCVGMGLTNAMRYEPNIGNLQNYNERFAIEQIYWEAQKNDPFPGGEYPGASPRMGGTSLLEGVKQLKRLGLIKSYRWAFSLEEMILGLGYFGVAIVGIPWYSRMSEPESDGRIRIGGQIEGGHCLDAIQYNKDTGKIRLAQSWGDEHGDRGEVYCMEDDMDRLLHERGECVFLEKA